MDDDGIVVVLAALAWAKAYRAVINGSGSTVRADYAELDRTELKLLAAVDALKPSED